MKSGFLPIAEKRLDFVYKLGREYKIPVRQRLQSVADLLLSTAKEAEQTGNNYRAERVHETYKLIKVRYGLK